MHEIAIAICLLVFLVIGFFEQRRYKRMMRQCQRNEDSNVK